MTGLAEAVASLYGGPLEAFVAKRDALVLEVRAGGDRDLAATIKALRKPTVAADALNRALRADPDAVETLLATADRLRSTQETLLAGEAAATGADFAADQAAYRTAAEAVAANAPSHEVEVRAAIDAAAIGGLVEELRAAAFATMPAPVGGLGPFMAGAGAGAGAVWPGADAARDRASRAARGADDRGDPSEPSEPSEPSAAERRMAERARKAAERALEQAEAAAVEAAESAETAAGVVDDLDEQLAELSDRLVELRARRDDAVTARAEADVASSAAAERAATARAVLDELTDP